GDETRAPLKEGAEQKRDQQHLKATVFRAPADRGLQGLERAFLHRQPVEEDDIENDPANREKARDRAEHGRTQRHIGGHRENDNGDENRDKERDNRRDVSFYLVRRAENKKGYDRPCGPRGRQKNTVQWVVYLVSPPCSLHSP